MDGGGFYIPVLVKLDLGLGEVVFRTFSAKGLFHASRSPPADLTLGVGVAPPADLTLGVGREPE